MIFPKLSMEPVLQVNDKTRIKANLSFVSADETAITNVEIEPDAGAGYISVFNSGNTDKWYLDWSYSTNGDKTVSVRVTNDGGSDIATGTISVLSEAEDYLFSKDEDLLQHEQNILEYVPKGRNSWLDKHRAAQDIILAYLDEQRIWRRDGSRYEKADVIDILEVNEWSKYLTLKLIFRSLQVSVDDIFALKALEYEELEKSARSRGALRLDHNQDGEIDKPRDKVTTWLVRR